MTVKLPLDERTNLITLMVKSNEFDSHEKRRNFFFVTGYEDSLPKVVSAVSLDANHHQFCTTLVRLLLEYGVLPDSDRHALNPLLDYLHEALSGQETERLMIEELLDLINS